MPNLELVKKTDVSSFRKIAIGTWQTAYDPSVYGTMEIRMDDAMKYIADFRAFGLSTGGATPTLEPTTASTPPAWAANWS